MLEEESSFASRQRKESFFSNTPDRLLDPLSLLPKGLRTGVLSTEAAWAECEVCHSLPRSVEVDLLKLPPLHTCLRAAVLF